MTSTDVFRLKVYSHSNGTRVSTSSRTSKAKAWVLQLKKTTTRHFGWFKVVQQFFMMIRHGKFKPEIDTSWCNLFGGCSSLECFKNGMSGTLGDFVWKRKYCRRSNWFLLQIILEPRKCKLSCYWWGWLFVFVMSCFCIKFAYRILI